MFNDFLMQLSPETGLEMYNNFGYLQYPAFVAVLLFATFKYNVPVRHKIALWFAFFIARFWGIKMVWGLNRITRGVIPANFGVAFILIIMCLAAIMYLLRVPVLFSLDVAVPAFILGRGLLIIGCVFTGCCHGFYVPWGIYSRAADTFTFPTVLLDVVFSLCIVGYLIFLSGKIKYSGSGQITAMGFILFGLLRLLIDILRDNEKLLLFLTSEGLFGISYAVGGYLLLRYIYRKG